MKDLPAKKDIGTERAPLPEVRESRLVYQGRVVTMRVEEIELPDGRTVEREVVEHPGAVVVVALDEAGFVYLVRQYRHPIRGTLLELPAGGIEADEDPLEAAKRELREEVGIEAKEWKWLGSFFSSPGFANENLHAFLARDLVESRRDPDEDEDLVVERYKLRDVLGRLDMVPDAKSLATLLLLDMDPEYGDQC